MATIHVDEIKALARQAHTDQRKRESLFAALHSDDRKEAVQAAWVLTHLPKEDNLYIAEHREELTTLAVSTSDTSLRRITLTLLERLEWTTDGEPPRYYMTLLDFCLDRMMLSDEPYGIRSLCMKLAYKISLPYPDLLGELRQNLMLLQPSELGRGVQNTRKNLMKLLMQ